MTIFLDHSKSNLVTANVVRSSDLAAACSSHDTLCPEILNRLLTRTGDAVGIPFADRVRPRDAIEVSHIVFVVVSNVVQNEVLFTPHACGLTPVP